MAASNTFSGLPLDDVLRLSAFGDCRVLAGKKPFLRPVCGLNQLDAPDIAHWAKENELLITTGFFIKDTPEELKCIIEEAHSLCLAGIRIKPKRFFERVPESYSPTPTEKADKLVQETLGSLLEYSLKNREKLLLTLEAYFFCFGNLKKMSETLRTHYNTIIYRIKRIEELTGLSLDNEEDRLTLEWSSGCTSSQAGKRTAESWMFSRFNSPIDVPCC